MKSSLKVKIDQYKCICRSEYINLKYVYEYKNKKRERKKERDILSAMSVTSFVSHFERSPLNFLAPQNTTKRDIKKEFIKRENR